MQTTPADVALLAMPADKLERETLAHCSHSLRCTVNGDAES